MGEPDVMHPYSAAPFLKVAPEVAVVEPGASQLFVLEGVVPEDVYVGDGGKICLCLYPRIGR